jgi:hypothetical protein
MLLAWCLPLYLLWLLLALRLALLELLLRVLMLLLLILLRRWLLLVLLVLLILLLLLLSLRRQRRELMMTLGGHCDGLAGNPRQVLLDVRCWVRRWTAARYDPSQR